MKVVIFFGFLYLYGKKVVWIWGWDLGCVMGESIDFSRVLRYWVRYWDFWGGWLKSGDFTGVGGILDWWVGFLSLCRVWSAYAWNENQNTRSGFWYAPSKTYGFFSFYRREHMFVFWKLDYFQVVLKTMCYR